MQGKKQSSHNKSKESPKNTKPIPLYKSTHPTASTYDIELVIDVIS